MSIILFLYFQFLSNKSRFNLNYLLLLIPILFIGIYLANDFTDGNLLLRYQGETNGTLYGTKEKNINNITTGRLDIFLDDFDLFKENFILGVGVKQSVYMRNTSEGIIAHVEIGRLLSEHGIFGLVVSCIFILLLFNAFQKAHQNLVNSILFILYFIGLYTTFHAATRTFVSPLFMSIILVKGIIPKN